MLMSQGEEAPPPYENRSSLWLIWKVPPVPLLLNAFPCFVFPEVSLGILGDKMVTHGWWFIQARESCLSNYEVGVADWLLRKS